jgi:heme/copper-type cytochrome/quinol oxidase subunit 2
MAAGIAIRIRHVTPSDWLLPTNYSAHGASFDRVFDGIFWLCALVLVAVLLLLTLALWKFRDRPEAKVACTHGNRRLELIWSAIPLALLLAIAFWSNHVWATYRASGALDDPHAAHVLLIARQFNWNAIYPGPDEKLGKYLVFPHLGDPRWPVDLAGKPVTIPATVSGKWMRSAGPAELPRDAAIAAIARYLSPGTTNPTDNDFGKVFDPDPQTGSPEGADDVINNPQNVLELPVNRTTILEITSMDVIHDFYLPNFRLNIYAVPGMTIRVALTPTMTSAQHASEGGGSGYWEFACAQLCGALHTTMVGKLYVLDQADWSTKYERSASTKILQDRP